MKNEKMIKAWNAVGPDNAADERMRSAILDRSRSVRKEKEKNIMETNTNRMKRVWIPIAACLTLLIAVTVMLGAGGFGIRNYTVKLENGDTISYRKTNVSASSLDFGYDYGVTTRELNTDELLKISPLLTSGFGTFRTDTRELVRFEGAADQTKVIIAIQGVPVTDTIIDEDPGKNEVCGITVSTGYGIANNGGKPVALFSGEFQLGSITVYTERSAAVADAKATSEALSNTILMFIENGEPLFSSVTM